MSRAVPATVPAASAVPGRRAAGPERRAAGPRGDGLGSALDLLDRAQATLLAACRATTSADRYVAAHLGALRCAAALLAAHPQAGLRGGPVRTVWSHLGRIAPELGEWADYFALIGARRAQVEGGATPTRREADDVLRSAETFATLVRGALGLPTETGAPAGPLAAVGWP
ncbi:MAG: hypothetical protein IPK37_18950 [Austwickia sp.]|nr:MAG: hypothetical protein IPK37_18950 [Austwickia sp.]